MIPSPVNIVCEPDVENMLPEEKENASPDKQPYIKHRVNPYLVWFHYRQQEIVSLYPNVSMAEINKQVDAEWNLLTMERKQPFIDEARRLSEQYKRDHPEYKFESGNDNLNAFNLWSRDRKREIAFANPYLLHSEINMQLGVEWNLLTMKDKQPFIDEAKRAREKHLRDAPSQYKFICLDSKNSRQELNASYSVYTNASTSSSIHTRCPEPQQNNEESPLDLSVRKARLQPFIDETKRPREENLRDHPDSKCTYRRKKKSVMNTLEPPVFPHSMSSIFPPNFHAQEYMSKASVTAHCTEQRNNPTTQCIPTYKLYSTTHPAILNDSNPPCTQSRTSTSMTVHNVLSQSVPRYQYEYINLGHYSGGHVSNINDSFHNITRNSCNVYIRWPETQNQNELSAFELFVKKYQ